jgi:glycine cleavage system H lipoate-binding protein
MHALLTTLQNIGIFIAGLVVRFGLLVAVLLILTVVFLVGLGIVRFFGLVRRKLEGVRSVDGVLHQPGIYYAPGHTWIRAAGENMVEVGMNDLAQRLFPGMSAIGLPAVGATIGAGHAAVQVTCGDKHATMVSPVEGKVVAINEAVRHDPSIARRDPYHRGWLFKFEVPDGRYTRLPYGDAARTWLDKEAIRLAHFIEGQLAMAAADGGELLAPGPALLNDEQWSALTRAFLEPISNTPPGS